MPMSEARAGYFDLDYYTHAETMAAQWWQLREIPADRQPPAADRAACEALIYAEARLIDAARLEEWLALFTEECGYWIPTDIDGANPSRVVSWEFNDRRRLEERVERLLGGRAYSQIPYTRTTHLYSNLEMLTAGPDAMDVFCNFLIATNRAGRPGSRAGWNFFRLRRIGEAWRIELKRVSLFDADLPQDNNSFTL
jgi:benzoate/toluate 1,2-dioxygenase beta subunit